MDKWSVYTAKVYFEDAVEQYKIRPIIALGDRGLYCDSLKITSQQKNDWRHVELTQWRAAGLDKPSWVDVSKVLKVPDNLIIEKIGTLDVEDIQMIMRAMNRIG